MAVTDNIPGGQSYLCPHELDMRVYPRCYLCTPELNWVTPPNGTVSISWCSACYGWHAPGNCRTTIRYFDSNTTITCTVDGCACS